MEQYAEAVASALAGNQEGYDFLYQSTYQKKFFIAKKYMGNDMDAQDVLQDAYVQAFTKLNTLQDYQKFPNWFGMIVANTAKNALKKKKMLFFSDLEGVNEEGEAMELNIMDTDASRQPEIAYTEKETQEMVHEMLDIARNKDILPIPQYKSHTISLPVKSAYSKALLYNFSV